jgi:LysR family transcriptional regulator, regulator for metE and metH
MLEFRHLRSLVAIHESDKLADAAERVFLTQSALSHQIRAIEAHYNVSLFERTAMGLRFTPAGERLLALARTCLADLGQAERDLTHLHDNARGEMRIVLECHTCFDWLMPVLDEFRRCWPEVEVDLVAGFHSEPLQLLKSGRADLLIGSKFKHPAAMQSVPLFRFEVMAVLPIDHPLRTKRRMEAADFAGATLITYPVPEERIDVIREFLKPAGVKITRRTTELTIAILQLVASKRGLAALPNWGLTNYLSHDYVLAKRIGKNGLWSDLYAIGAKSLMTRAYCIDLMRIIREQCSSTLDGIKLL